MRRVARLGAAAGQVVVPILVAAGRAAALTRVVAVAEAQGAVITENLRYPLFKGSLKRSTMYSSLRY